MARETCGRRTLATPYTLSSWLWCGDVNPPSSEDRGPGRRWGGGSFARRSVAFRDVMQACRHRVIVEPVAAETLLELPPDLLGDLGLLHRTGALRPHGLHIGELGDKDSPVARKLEQIDRLAGGLRARGREQLESFLAELVDGWPAQRQAGNARAGLPREGADGGERFSGGGGFQVGLLRLVAQP